MITAATQRGSGRHARRRLAAAELGICAQHAARRRTDPPCRRRGPYKSVLAQHRLQSPLHVRLHFSRRRAARLWTTSRQAAPQASTAHSPAAPCAARFSGAAAHAARCADCTRKRTLQFALRALRSRLARQGKSVFVRARLCRLLPLPPPDIAAPSGVVLQRRPAIRQSTRRRCSAELTSSSFSEMPARRPTVSKEPPSR